MIYWVITDSEEAFGPYDSEEAAYMFATINLGMYGWTITKIEKHLDSIPTL